jgi:hypothetical protein
MTTLRTLLAGALPLVLLGSVATTSSAQDGRISTTDRIAVINANGTKESGFGLVSSTRIGVGTYDLRWNRNITKCAAVATLGSPTSFGVVNGTITVVQRSGSAGRGHFIQTFNQANPPALEDREFMISVACS